MGATSGRTTLNGEGLQHQDGHSHLFASTVPNCVSYDPTFTYELAVIIQDGLRRMYAQDESIFYYVTTLNEGYRHPPMPKNAEEGIRRGMYLVRESASDSERRVQLLGCGAILREVLAAAEVLENDFEIASDVWSVPSFTELRREGLAVERWNRLHPEEEQRRSYVEECLRGRRGPVVASTDYVRGFADQIRAWIPRRYVVLGADGYGRSDTRDALRDFFEIDRRHVTLAALKALADEGTIETDRVAEGMRKYDIGSERPDPWAL
jgi:pyruvate dehydrogenase E1 component